MIRSVSLGILAAIVLVGGAVLMTGSVEAQGTPIGGGPCPYGWTCQCNSTVVDNVACVRSDGSPGQVVVTVCQKCPPPDCDPFGVCRLRVCQFSVSASCR